MSAIAMASLEAPVGDAPLWLPLLRELTRGSSRWAVHGDVEEGFARGGDVDLVAPETEWPLVIDGFRSWFADSRIGPVVVCKHKPGVMILVALRGSDLPFLELEVLGRKFFKGGQILVAEDLAPVMQLDPRGFRTLRPGARALIKLIPNGLSGAGRARWPAAKLRRVGAALAEDPDGVELTARLFGRAEGAAVRLAHAVAAGRWDRGAAIQVSAWGASMALKDPALLTRRAARAAKGRPRCVVLETISVDRRTILDERTWLARARGSHQIHLGGLHE